MRITVGSSASRRRALPYGTRRICAGGELTATGPSGGGAAELSSACYAYTRAPCPRTTTGGAEPSNGASGTGCRSTGHRAGPPAVRRSSP